jgi:hypothetical protein
MSELNQQQRTDSNVDIATGAVYGGGNQADVQGNTNVELR